MLFSISIYAIIPFLTLLQGLLFTILLVIRGNREERHADFWQAFVLFLMAINGVPYMLGWMGITILWEKYTYLPWDGFWLAIPPVVYLFLRSITNDQWRFNWKKDSWFFLPYLLHFTEHSIVGIIGFTNKNLLIKWTTLPYLGYLNTLLSWGVEIYFFVLSYHLYQNYKKWTFNEFSDPERISFSWLRNFLIIRFVLTLINIANTIVVRLSSENGNDYYALMWWGYLMETILIYYLSISGYMQTRAKSIRFVEDSNEVSINNNDIKEEIIQNTVEKESIKPKSIISPSDLLEWKSKVLNYFEQNKPYLNPELTLSELAMNLKTNTSILSQVINTGFEKNFNDFVNHYRVEEFKHKTKSKEFEHFTLLAIALDCGFNSKATFNRAFKKITGNNPSNF